MCRSDITARIRIPFLRRHRARSPGAAGPGPRTLVALLLLGMGSVAAAERTATIRGLPFIRRYAFEDIGNISRGGRLGFDSFGRVAIIQDGTYSVLNDATWIEIAEHSGGWARMINVVQGTDGHAYYGAYGSWGIAELGANGKLRPRSLVPAGAPGWVAMTNFSEIVVTPGGLYFAGFNGVVYFDIRTRRHQFFPTAGVSRIFALGDRAYVSCHQKSIQYIDISSGELRPIPGTDLGGLAADRVGTLDHDRALISTRDGRIQVFDGTALTPWAPQQRDDLTGRVSAIKQLLDASMAIAINGKGLFLISRGGDVLLSLTNPEYQNIADIATSEPGVLWISSESGVEKILYEKPVSRFGQPLGLPISWPQVVRWRNSIIVASGGRLYEPIPDSGAGVTRFQAVPAQPIAGSWGIAASGSQLLIGNSQGVLAVEPDGRSVQVLTQMDVSRLVMVEGEICYAIGASEIAVLRRDGERWIECAPRIPGLGYPSIVHATKSSAWIELGANRAARVVLRDGKLQARLFDKFPWTELRWVNVSTVDDTVMLSGPPDVRLFFSEQTEDFSEAPELRQLLDRSPYPVERVRKAKDGTLWASHEHGVFTLVPENHTYRFDTTTFDILDDRTPFVQSLPDGEVWISTGYALYHVDRQSAQETRNPFTPILVSAVNARNTDESFLGSTPTASLGRVPFGANNLSLRFFAGSYSSYRSPMYEYRLNQETDTWASLGTGSLLSFPELHEGHYQLDVRVRDNHGPLGTPARFTFEILPPWYRTSYAYTLYGLAAVLSLYGVVRWTGQQAKARNAVLEKLVQDRTNELKVAMEKLNEETRNAATLAERDRLACEIHDSLQQGLSGLILQLDATLKLPSLTSDVRSRLSVARNMVSFTRHEVQHAVWDMETPLLEGTELQEALRKLTALISPGTVRIQVSASGAPCPLSSSTKHHLLRIAQEAITNAVRHAAAGKIDVHIDYQADSVTLTVEDDGKGFDADEMLANGLGHFGLRGLRGRAAKIGGDVKIRSAPGKGTSIRVTAPTQSETSSSSHAADPAAR
ncbi:sensor histidine kinase [Opitutaceae bacterium EW11]|nr:sensor histidine kinase [Opitutaceae bacterium EW11]